MDRYRATERTLKLAATHSCKVNGAIIKDDFVNIATRAASEGVTLKGTKELVKECFLEKATSDTNTLQNGCNLLIDTLALLEGLSNPKTVREDYKSNTKTSLATIAKCAKGCQFKQSDKTVVLCNISDINAFISINGKTDLCSNEHSDGFYNLNILESRRVGETSRVSSVNNNVLETLEAYTGGTKNLSFGQGFTILSEKNIIDNADTSDIIKDDDESFLLKNVNVTQLLPGSHQTVIKSVYNPFEPYYEDLKEVYACSRDNGVTTYVGGMYPPLHTYYTKHTGRKHIISPIVSQNCIRQVWCEPRSTLANSLLKSSKKSKNKLPFAFVVPGQVEDNYIDIVFINVSTIRSHSSASLSP
uniref:Uncharacterized protein n=2 Tax=Babesia bovis TaxID=5865 RepID=A7ARN0_BABBO|eukprot:XP_001610767.1 hypothetical protein [Babesia bovis T2Bo]